MPSIDTEALAARIFQNEQAVHTSIASLRIELGALQAALAPSREDTLRRAGAVRDQRRTAAEVSYQLRAAQVETELATELTTAEAVSRRITAELAPGAASAEWVLKAWEELSPTTAPAPVVRLGTIRGFGPSAAVTESEVPVLAPLGPGQGWIILGDPADGRELLFQTVLRLVAQSPLPNIVVESFDPRTSAALAPLAPLRALYGASFPSAAVDADSFVRRLETVAEGASLNAERVVSGGARSLTELWRAQRSPEGTLTIVTVIGYPYGVTPRLHQMIRRLAELGPSAGVIVLVQEDAGLPPSEPAVRSADLRSVLRTVSVDNGRVRSDGLPEAAHDSEPSRELVAQIFARIQEQMSDDQGPSIPLSELSRADLATPWTKSAIDSVDATIGQVGDRTVTLSFRTANPPHPNMLAGGMVGSGKSTLLLDVIYSLALGYSPEELELILLDFKQGVEFNVFAPDAEGRGWLPHATVLGLETDPEFGLAVFRHIVAELERRADLFKAAGVSNYVDYRRVGSALPRLMVIVDEFHELFGGDEEQARLAVRLLETVARQGRSAGVHLLLASQTISGIPALGSKGDAIFSQFPLRLSLKNTPQESQAILASQNKAAADLRYRGEFVLNRESGDERANERGVAAFVEGPVFSEAQSRMSRMRAGRMPRIFYARRAADLDRQALAALTPREDIELWAGVPIDVVGRPEAIVLRHDMDQTVAILGADTVRDPMIPGVVAGMFVTAAQQMSADDTIVVLTGDAETMPSWLAAAFRHAQVCGVGTRHVPASRAARYLRDEIGARTRESIGRVVLFALRVPQIPDLDTDPSDIVPEPDAGDAGFIFSNDRVQREVRLLAGASGSAASVLTDIARNGALRGVHLIGWWPNVQTMNDLLGIAHRGIGTYLTAGLGLDDLRTVSSTHRVQMEGHPRVGLIRRSGTGGLTSVVPFATWSEDT